MGVGVYSSDFDNTGGSFLVSGTLCTTEDYEAFRAAEPDSNLDYNSWSENEVEFETQRLRELIQQAGSELGFGIVRSREFGGEDSAFRVLAERGGFSVGVRGWEHDYVVGVWQPDTDYGCNREAAKEEIAGGYLDNPDTVLTVRDELSKNLQEYVRLIVQEEFECCYKVGAYQSARYPDLSQADLAVRLDELKDSIKEGFDYLDLEQADRIKTWDADDFKAMIEAFRENFYWRPINVPIYDAVQDALIWINPTVSLDSDENLAVLEKFSAIPEGVERPAVPEGERYVAFASSDALLEACREATISSLNRYRAPMYAPVELWCEVCGADLDLAAPAFDDAYDSSLSM